MNNDTAGKLGFAVFALFFLLMFACAISDFIFYFDLAPARGTAQGFIYFQERSGVYQLDVVCWKDTPYSECEWFDPAGKTYPPGKYTMEYQCERFVWAWEHPNECMILNATKIGDVA